MILSEITIRDDCSQSIKIRRDAVYDGIWRVQYPNGPSDMVNLTRADAAGFYLENLQRQKRRAAQAHRSPPVREKTPRVSKIA